jgi:citronellol/citronellal dehydrogenase
VQAARGPQIMADAAHAILTCSNLAGSPLAGTSQAAGIGPGGAPSGNFFTDEQVLAAAGVTDFRPYSLGAAEEQLVPDIFL